MMQFQFDHHLDYQLAVIEAVCDLFTGQEVCRTEFTVTAPRGLHAADDAQRELLDDTTLEPALGVGNRLMLLDDELLANLRKVQSRQGLAPAGALASRDFTVEMETGTGKTYVYLRTVFELNRRYGFSKIVVVVPSVAIKGTLFDDALRDVESAKIGCGKAHFEGLATNGDGAKYVRVTSVDGFSKHWS